MKIGDLVRTHEHSEVFIYMGKGLWKGWSLCYCLKTGKKYQFSTTDLEVVDESR